MGLQPFGKILIVFGLVLLGVGVVFTLLGKAPWFGKLPGDILVERKNFQFYFPLATCILISVFLSLLFFLFKR